MDRRDEIREAVSRAYAEALAKTQSKAPVATGCCSSASCAPTAKLVDYGDTAAQFEEALASSFGCGNPAAFAGLKPGQTVLDLGSGAGLDLLIAASRVGPTGRVIGVDMTDEMLSAARANAKKAGYDNIELRKGIIEELPVESSTVDWVISNCVINLSPEKPRVFKELARVLKPGGRISISDIVSEELPAWVRESAQAYAACVAGAISEDAYLEGLRSHGLRDVEVADRLRYDEGQLLAMVGIDAATSGPMRSLMSRALQDVVGKVWSARFVGTK